MAADHNAYVFLSYHSYDREIAKAIYEFLTTSGFKVWFDRKWLEGTDDWCRKIQEGLKETNGFVVILTKHAPLGWVQAEVDAAVRRYYDTLPRPDPNAPKTEVTTVTNESSEGAKPSKPHYLLLPLHVNQEGKIELYPHEVFLNAFQGLPLKLRESNQIDQEHLQQLLKVLDEKFNVADEVRYVVKKPFKGLAAYNVADSHLFFGREQQVEELLRKMDELRFRWVYVHGSSGSGKSSLIRAGLIPALRRRLRHQTDSERDWAILMMRPSVNPIEQLIDAWRQWEVNEKIRPETESPYDARHQISQALKREEGLHELIQESRGRYSSTQTKQADFWNFLLVIDQFEELFTLGDQQDDQSPQKHFAKLIAYAINRGCPLWIVSTIRTDFHDRVEANGDWVKLLVRSEEYLVKPMEQERLKSVILGPLKMAGGSIGDDALLEELLKQANAHRDTGLCLLSHVLAELWEKAKLTLDKRMRLTYLYELGGFQGAISRSADSVLRNLSDTDRDIAQKLLLQLVQVGYGGDKDTKKRVIKTDLLNQFDLHVREHADNILHYLARGRFRNVPEPCEDKEQPRLIMIDHREDNGQLTTVELIHDQLIYTWPTYKELIDQSRNDLLRVREIEASATIWQQGNCADAFLPGLGRLEEFDRWNATPLPLSTNAINFMTRFRAYRDELAQRERDLRSKEQRQLKRNKRFAQVVGVLCLGMMGVLSWGLLQYFMKIQSEENERTLRLISNEKSHSEYLDAALRASLDSENELASRKISALKLNLTEYRQDPITEFVSNIVERRSAPEITSGTNQTLLPVEGTASKETFIYLKHYFQPEWTFLREPAAHRNILHPNRVDRVHQEQQYESINIYHQLHKKLHSVILDGLQSYLCASPDGSKYAYLTQDRRVVIRDSLSGEILSDWPGLCKQEKRLVYSTRPLLSFTVDSRYLVTVGDQEQIHVIDVATSTLLKQHSITRFPEPPTSYSPWQETIDDVLFASTTAVNIDAKLQTNYAVDQELHVCNLITRERYLLSPVTQRPYPKNSKNELVKPNGEWIDRAQAAIVLTLHGDDGRDLDVFDATGKKLINMTFEPKDIISNIDVQFSKAVEIGQQVQLTTFDLRTGKQISQWTIPRRRADSPDRPIKLQAITGNMDQTCIALLWSDKEVEIWNLPQKRRLHHGLVNDSQSKLLLSEDGEMAIVARSTNDHFPISGIDQVKVYRNGRLEPVNSTRVDEVVSCWHPSSNGKQFILGYMNGHVSLRDACTGKESQHVVVSTHSIRDVLFNDHDSTFIAWDGVRLTRWDVQSGKLINTFNHFVPINAITPGLLTGFFQLMAATVQAEATVLRIVNQGQLIMLVSREMVTVIDPSTFAPILQQYAPRWAYELNLRLDARSVVLEDRVDNRFQYSRWLFSSRSPEQLPEQFNALQDHSQSAHQSLFMTESITEHTYWLAIDGTLNLVQQGKLVKSIPKIDGLSRIELMKSQSGVLTIDQKALRIWSVKPKVTEPLFEIPVGDVVAISSDTSTAAMWFKDRRELVIWDIEHEVMLSQFTNITGVQHLMFGPVDSSKLLVSIADKTKTSLQLWDHQKMAPYQQRTTRTDFPIGAKQHEITAIRAATFTRQGQQVALGDDNFLITQWPLLNGQFAKVRQQFVHYHHADETKRDDPGHWANINRVVSSPDGERIASVALDQRVHIWRTSPISHEIELKPATPFQGVYRYGISFDPTGKYLVIADGVSAETYTLRQLQVTLPQKMRVFDTTNWDELEPFDGHDDVIWCITFRADGQQMATCSQDGTIRLWNVATRKLLHSIPKAHQPANAGVDPAENWVLSVCLSADGSRLVSGGRSDKLLKIWSVDPTGVTAPTLLHQLEGHEGSITKICVDSRGDRAFTASGDGTVRIWNLKNGLLKLTLPPHRHANTGRITPVWGLDIHESNGQVRKLLSTGEDGTVRLWQLAPE